MVPRHRDRREEASAAARNQRSGEYRVPLLPPGVYSVRVEATGFTTRVMTGATVLVGQTLTLNAQLEVGAVTTEITVQAEPPVVETERTQQANTIDRQRIDGLPINRRNYLDFALLAPGVVETNHLVDSTDYRVVQTPQSGLSFGGGNGRGNNFTVDGAENYLTPAPCARPSARKRCRNSRSTATRSPRNPAGLSAGPSTSSPALGSNTLHGNLFGFLRQRDLQARNFFDPVKSAFTRGQYGATLGAPIQRDKTFLFPGYERLDRHETSFVPILQDRTAFASLHAPPQQQTAHSYAPCRSSRPTGR